MEGGEVPLPRMRLSKNAHAQVLPPCEGSRFLDSAKNAPLGMTSTGGFSVIPSEVEESRPRALAPALRRKSDHSQRKSAVSIEGERESLRRSRGVLFRRAWRAIMESLCLIRVAQASVRALIMTSLLLDNL